MLAICASAREPLDRPNFVVILLDDAGYGDFSHTGNPTIHTPNVARMVNEGLNFPQFYTASPACSASRYALLTGRSPARSGFGTWVLSPSSPRYLHPSEVTIAEALKKRGYATGFYGKWHLGNPNQANQFSTDALPLAHGFDVWEGTNVSNDYDPGADLYRGNERIASDILNKLDIHENLTRRYRDLAVEFIKANADDPFFLYLAPNMPHLPVLASRDFKGRSLRGLYGDVIEELDVMVGQIMNTLEQQGVAQNTLVVFTSDNGPWIRFENTESHEKYGEARFLVGSARPFRDGKGSTWEGGVRVPGVFWWPGVIHRSTVVRQPAATFDILPTVLSLAGGPIPSDRTLDGRDIRGYLNRDLFPQPAAFHFIYTGASDNRAYGARQGPWKLHTRLYSQTGNDYGFTASVESPLLFNVEVDPSERIDVAERHPSEVARLKSAIEEFEASVQADRPFWER